MFSLRDHIRGVDVSGGPVEVAEGVYWVGHYLPGDPFQCHAYLLFDGEEGVLIDPGSALTFEHVRAKVEAITPFSNIRWILAHHQDADITGALPDIDRLVEPGQVKVVTHWRAHTILRHLGLKNLEWWLIDAHDWVLEAAGRRLEFVFTPYAHFPGAFCTYDTESEILFSSDLFGGFTEGFRLVAPGPEYFEAMRPFHEHYIPSREVMQYALQKIEEKDPKFIAPQHGSMIPAELIPEIFSRLGQLECGLYLMADRDTNITRLSKLNRALQQMTRTVLNARGLGSVVKELLAVTAEYLPVKQLEFYGEMGDAHVHFAPESRYRGVRVELPGPLAEVVSRATADARRGSVHPLYSLHAESGPQIVVPLHTHESAEVHAVAVFRLERKIRVDAALREALDRIGEVLAVAVEREALYRSIEEERERIYRESIRDPLTRLYTRRYLVEAFERWARERARRPERDLGLLLLDIDHFKGVNDTYGHLAGDEVLRRVGQALLDATRTEDVVVRYGGEELAVFLFNAGSDGVKVLAERLRASVAALTFEGELSSLHVTTSVGVAMHEVGDDLEDFVARADEALYLAKESGRNQVRHAAPRP